MSRGSRDVRVAQEIQRVLADLLPRAVKDPRVPTLVTVTAVELTPDLAHAKVFVTFLAGSASPDDTVKALNHCAAFLRHELARRIRLRHVPTLAFQYDKSIEQGIHLTRLIDEATHSGTGRGGE